ncbi:MAG: hydrolase 2, exosortase A system-associated [Pseudomonadota bacterium]
MAEPGRGSFEPGFLATDRGPLFLLTYPARDVSASRAIVVFPAFAEEMNKCRRQLALAARAFAPQGITTYIPDLTGTGDSHGDFGDASLGAWRDDLAAVLAHVAARGHSDVAWLAVRAGALLATDALANGAPPPSQLLVWQPVSSGKTMMSQFLRLKSMAGLGKDQRGPSVSELRKTLSAGTPVEVAGYWLHPDLVAGFDTLALKTLAGVERLDWCAVQSDSDLPAAAASVVETLTAQGVDVRTHIVEGEPFWSTAEIALAPALTRATSEALSR